MTPPSEHTNRRSSPHQAWGRPWPILVLLFGLTALTLALTACGGSSNTGSPDATGSTETNEWDETVTFSVGWLDTQLI